MTGYKLVNNKKGVLCSVTRLADGLSIPLNPENRHYEEYLAWVAEGNTAEAAD